MEKTNTCKRTPEEQELDKKLAELTLLEVKLAELELEFSTLQDDLNAFKQQYQLIVGVRYTELSNIESEIERYLVLLKSTYFESRTQTQEISAKTSDSQQANEINLVNTEFSKDFKPRESLKQLYRELAKRIHPDFTTDKAECLRRHNLMAEVNEAYKNGDEAKLEAILYRWQHSPELVQGEGIGAELIRTIRKIAQVQERLKMVESNIDSVVRSPLYHLFEKVVAAQYQGRDLLAEMAEKIDLQMAEPKLRLEALKTRLSKLGF